jgi:hypothetical protein
MLTNVNSSLWVSMAANNHVLLCDNIAGKAGSIEENMQSTPIVQNIDGHSGP